MRVRILQGVVVVLFAASGFGPRFPAADAAPAGTVGQTALGIEGTQFTVDGRTTFLLGFSYFAALGAPEGSIRKDLTAFKSRGFNWLRVWATWEVSGEDISAVNERGEPREPFFDRLKWLVAECARQGLVVDVTLARGKPSAAGGRLADFAAHQRAVTTLVSGLKTHSNWYLDLANEHDVRDDRYVSDQELKSLIELGHRLDPRRLMTASFGGHDLSSEDVRAAVVTVGVDFLCPHRPRHQASPAGTESQTRACLDILKKLGRPLPILYQEPFRRGYSEWEPKSQDFLADLKGAVAGGAAGWCFHNGTQRGAQPHELGRSFDLRTRGLFDQLDSEERLFIDQAAISVLRFRTR